MDYDLIVVKTLERVYKNYYYIIRGEKHYIATFEKSPPSGDLGGTSIFPFSAGAGNGTREIVSN